MSDDPDKTDSTPDTLNYADQNPHPKYIIFSSHWYWLMFVLPLLILLLATLLPALQRLSCTPAQ